MADAIDIPSVCLQPTHCPCILVWIQMTSICIFVRLFVSGCRNLLYINKCPSGGSPWTTKDRCWEVNSFIFLTLSKKHILVKAMVFPVVIWLWELDCEESWALKNWSFWTVVLEKTLESPLDCKEIQPVHPKGDQSWVFIGRTDVEAETPILWPPDAKDWLIWKDPDAGKYWGQKEKGTTEDEMIGWHHRLNGHGFGWTLGVGDGQGGLACCGSWGRKESDMTERLNWTDTASNPFRVFLKDYSVFRLNIFRDGQFTMLLR